MLRRLDYIGRENAVLRDLKDAPKDLHALYCRMVLECHTNRSPEQSEALRHLFAWLAFSKRPLTLSEAGALMKELVKDGIYDIEEEVIGRSTRYVIYWLTCMVDGLTPQAPRSSSKARLR